ncbi:MAG: bacillithiol system redox-active protein YtxJ [Chitinophagaceae bacterium]|nr:bacillithiol system redox-active protein YtxJ [Chitinophagaceae bacterium]
MIPDWTPLTDARQLDELVLLSASQPQIIFKHSTRCSISSTAWNRLRQADLPAGTRCYYLDLLSYRPLSAAIAEKFSVTHESPQVLLIRDGVCVYDESHLGITADELAEQVNQVLSGQE